MYTYLSTTWDFGTLVAKVSAARASWAQEQGPRHHDGSLGDNPGAFGVFARTVVLRYQGIGIADNPHEQ